MELLKLLNHYLKQYVYCFSLFSYLSEDYVQFQRTWGKKMEMKKEKKYIYIKN